MIVESSSNARRSFDTSRAHARVRGSGSGSKNNPQPQPPLAHARTREAQRGFTPAAAAAKTRRGET